MLYSILLLNLFLLWLLGALSDSSAFFIQKQKTNKQNPFLILKYHKILQTHGFSTALFLEYKSSPKIPDSFYWRMAFTNH